MKNLTLLFLMILSVYSVSAQDQASNSIQLNWGVGHNMRQNLNESPFIHQSWSAINVGLIYSRSKALEQEVLLNFGLYQPSLVEPYTFYSYYQGEESSLKHSFKMIDIDYAIGKKVVGDDKFSFLIGVRSRNFIYASDYNFGSQGQSPMFISFGLDNWQVTSSMTDNGFKPIYPCL